MTDSPERKLILPSGDSRVTEFIRRAGPIITAEQGMNERSHLKLRSLAMSLKLPDELFNLALEHFQQSGIKPKDTLSRTERSFVNELKKRLAKSSQNILSVELEKAGLRLGTEKYQLSSDLTRQLIHDVARELGLQRVSLKEAESHVQALVREQVGTATEFSPQLRERLQRVAESWGIERASLDDMIDETIEANLKLERKQQAARRVKLLGPCAVLVALIALGYIVHQRQQFHENQLRQRDKSASNATVEGTDQKESLTVESIPEIPVDFSRADWDAPQIERFQLAFETNALLQRYWRVLVLGDSSARELLFREMLDFVRRESSEMDSTEINEFLALLLEAEYDPRSLQILLDGLLEPVRVGWGNESDPINVAVTGVVQSFKAHRLAYQVWEKLNERFPQRKIVAEALHRATGADPIPQADAAEGNGEFDYVAAAERGLARQWLHYLSMLARRDPDRATPLVVRVKPILDPHLGDSASEERWQDVAMTILEQRPESFPALRSLLEAWMERLDTSQIVAWERLLQTTEDQTLQSWLADQLARQLGIESDRFLAEQLESIRKRRRELQVELLGGRHARIVAWLDHDPRLSIAVDSEQMPVATPQTVVDVARWATLALAWSEHQEELFQYLSQQPLPKLHEIVSANVARDRPRLINGAAFTARPTHHETLQSSLSVLADQEAQPASRAAALHRLARVADRFHDVDHRQAEVVLSFLLNAASDDEVVAMREALPKLGHWFSLHLALLNHLPHTTISQQRILLISRHLTGESFALMEEEPWQEQHRTQLLNWLSQAMRISVVEQNRDSDLLWDYVEHQMLGELQHRLRIRGLVEEGQQDTLTLVRMFASTFSPQALDRDWLVDDFLADDEYHRFVLAGRVLVSQVAKNLSVRYPHIEHKVGNILKWHEQHREQIDDHHGQLLINELALLKLWVAACLGN